MCQLLTLLTNLQAIIDFPFNNFEADLQTQLIA